MMRCLPEIVGHSCPALEKESLHKLPAEVGRRLTQPQDDKDGFRPVESLVASDLRAPDRKHRKVARFLAVRPIRPA